MSITDLFGIVPNWKQKKCLSRNWWISNLWHIHTMEDYLVVKKKGLLIVVYQTSDKSQKHQTLKKWKKSDIKENILYDSIKINSRIFMKFATICTLISNIWKSPS